MQARTILSRHMHKAHTVKVLRPLYDWTRASGANVEHRMRYVRELGDPSEEPSQHTKELASQMAFLVIQTLVAFGRGRQGYGKKGDKDYDYGLYPYGKPESRDTEVFKNIPNAWFAETLAEMYNFLRKDVEEWDGMLKKRAYPMPQLWSWGVVRRHMCFHRKFRENRDYLFQEYEAGGGEYHGSSQMVLEDLEKTMSTVDDDDSTDDDEFM